jgi:hypothetical protein
VSGPWRDEARDGSGEDDPRLLALAQATGFGYDDGPIPLDDRDIEGNQITFVKMTGNPPRPAERRNPRLCFEALCGHPGHRKEPGKPRLASIYRTDWGPLYVAEPLPARDRDGKQVSGPVLCDLLDDMSADTALRPVCRLGHVRELPSISDLADRAKRGILKPLIA